MALLFSSSFISGGRAPREEYSVEGITAVGGAVVILLLFLRGIRHQTDAALAQELLRDIRDKLVAGKSLEEAIAEVARQTSAARRARVAEDPSVSTAIWRSQPWLERLMFDCLARELGKVYASSEARKEAVLASMCPRALVDAALRRRTSSGG